MKLLKNFLASLMIAILLAGCSPLKGVNPEPNPNTFGALLKAAGWGGGHVKSDIGNGQLVVIVAGENCRAILEIFSSTDDPSPTPSPTPPPTYFRAVAVAEPAGNTTDRMTSQSTEGWEGFNKKNPTPDDFKKAVDKARKAQKLTVC